MCFLHMPRAQRYNKPTVDAGIARHSPSLFAQLGPKRRTARPLYIIFSAFNSSAIEFSATMDLQRRRQVAMKLLTLVRYCRFSLSTLPI